MILTMCHFDRPDYTRRSLEALARCRGIGDCLLVLHCEPGNPDVLRQLAGVDFCRREVVVNEARLTADPNTIRAFDHGFTHGDWLVHVEDDVCLAPDALEYFAWARDTYRSNPGVLAVTAYSRSAGPPHLVSRRRWLSPWGLGLWRDRWERFRPDVLRITGTDPATLTWALPGCAGYDGALLYLMIRHDLAEIYPALGRAQNIGSLSSIHDPAWYADHHAREVHCAEWAGDGRTIPDGVWHESGSSGLERPAPMPDWLRELAEHQP